MTRYQRSILDAVDMNTNSSSDGYCPLGSSAWGAIRSLAKLGYVIYVGAGQNADAPDDREYAIFAITDAGRAALEATEAGTPGKGEG